MTARSGSCSFPPSERGHFFVGFVPGRRGEILDAALDVFARKGYEGGTMREIAGCVGVTEPALYRHYAGKEALFSDLIAVAADHIAGKAGGALDALDPEHLRDSLRSLIGIRRGHAHQNEGVTRVMRTLVAAAPHHATFREVFRAHLARPMMERLAAMVPRIDERYGIERTQESLDSCLRAFLSLFVGYFMTGLMLDLPDDDEGILDAMLAVMGWVP